MAIELPAHPAGNRTTFVFCTDRLSPRDATLFKSFVRLLDHRTQHKWVCGSDAVDLHVVPEGGAAPRDAGKPASAVLTVGTSQRYLNHYLNLPIRADELETELNRLGTFITGNRPAAPAPDAQGGFRLLRWPPATLLGSPGHLRLATLMAAGAVSLQAAPLRSGLSASACSQFFDDLGRAGLLRADNAVRVQGVPAAQPRSDGTAHAQPSLIALIRNRLGLVASRP